MSSSISNLITVPTFSGQSTYSTDFQTILTKAAQSDSLQINQLQQQQNTDQAKLTVVQQIGTDFSNLQTAIANLVTAIGSGSLQGTVADPSIASVNVGSGASAGTYTLQVLGLGSTTQTVSADGLATVADPTTQNISSASTFTLTVNGVNTTITPAGTDLQDLVNAINQQNLGVAASIVDVGSQSAPDYRLAVQSTGLANVAIQLSDGTNNTILNTIAPGSPATYQVDGLATTISSDTSTITLAPRVTANLLSQSPAGQSTTITVQQTATATQTALQQFATAYNAVVTDLSGQHGTNAGPLQGDSILDAAQQVLETITGYSGSGSVASLSDLGLDLSTTGQMSFNASEFAANGGSDVQALSQFLGDDSSGFLGTISDGVSAMIDPTQGLFITEASDFYTSINNLQSQMTDQATLVNQQLQALQAQLSASDATISVLAGQVTYFTDLFFPPSQQSA
jgi:flagellar hook-associated protein 2